MGARHTILTGKSGVGKTAVLQAIRQGLLERHDYQRRRSTYPDVTFKPQIDLEIDPAVVDPHFYCKIDPHYGDSSNQDVEVQQQIENDSRKFADYCERKCLDPHYKIKDQNLQSKFDDELSRFMETYHATNNHSPRSKLEKHWKKVSTNIHVATFGTVDSNLDRIVKNRATETNLNTYLSTENFEYKVRWNEHSGSPRCTIVHKSRPDEWIALSPGEGVKLLMLLWQYDNQEFDKLKETQTVMLLDEPDANMHPTIVCEYIKRFKEEYVNKYNVQVIMTTHNPTTLCAVDKEDIFLVTKEPNGCPKVERVTNKQSAIRQLTPTMISIYEGVRFVFVEGTNDQEFYRMAYGKFVDRAKTIIGYIHNIQFCTPGQNEDSSSARVEAAVKRLTEDKDCGLHDCVFGIVDGDCSSQSEVENASKAKKRKIEKEKKRKIEDSNNSNNVFHLHRYSVENYIYDPVQLYFAWSAFDQSKKVFLRSKLKVLLKKLKKRINMMENEIASLQYIADEVTTFVREALKEWLQPEEQTKQINLEEILTDVMDFAHFIIENLLMQDINYRLEKCLTITEQEKPAIDVKLLEALQACLGTEQLKEMAKKIETNFKTPDIIDSIMKHFKKEFKDKVNEVLTNPCTVEQTIIKSVTNEIPAMLKGTFYREFALKVTGAKACLQWTENLEDLRKTFNWNSQNGWPQEKITFLDGNNEEFTLTYSKFWLLARGHSLASFLVSGEFAVGWSGWTGEAKHTEQLVSFLEHSEHMMLPKELCDIFLKIHGQQE
jgi:hypothetical protein